jgi:hypothetical protein
MTPAELRRLVDVIGALLPAGALFGIAIYAGDAVAITGNSNAHLELLRRCLAAVEDGRPQRRPLPDAAPMY